jgi:acetyltransferase-like isoleucine patch superfamily enzyme
MGNAENDVAKLRHYSNGESAITVGRFTYGHEAISVSYSTAGVALRIGSFSSIGANVRIFLGGNHRTDWITTFPFGHVHTDELGGIGTYGHPTSMGDVIIGNDVWLGYNSTIMSGVTIGDGAVVSANAHVVRDVAPYSMVGGNPAKEIKYRFSQEIIMLLLELKWWDLPLNEIKLIIPKLSSSPSVDLLRQLIDSHNNSLRIDLKG